MSKKFLSLVNLTNGATLPTSGSAGDLFFKSDELKIYVHDGTQWVIAQGSGGGGGVQVSDTPPADPTEGDYWFDSNTAKSYIYYDSFWIEVGSSGGGYIVSATAPSGPSEGDVWFSTTEGVIYVYYDGYWVDPSTAGSATAGSASITVSDVAPENPENDSMWFNSAEAAAYIYYDSTWVPLSPGIAGPAGPTGIIVSDTAPTNTAQLWADPNATGSYIVPANGSKGQVLAKVTDTSYDTGWVTPQGTGNLILNGGMEIAQRGTSFSSVSSVYTLDRWYYTSYGSATTANVSQGTTDGFPGIQHYMRVSANTSSSSNFNLTHTLETANVIPLRGKTITTSFWIRTPVAFTNTFILNLRYSTSADTRISNAGTGTIIGSDTVFAGSSTWTRITQTNTIPADATSLGFVLGTYNNTVSSAYFDITGVQMELGSIATPFRRNAPSIQAELAACQRYYWRFASTGFGGIGGSGYIDSSTTGTMQIQNPVPMRTYPTSVDSSNLRFVDIANGAGSVTGTLLWGSQPNMTNCVVTDFRISGSGFTTGRWIMLQVNGSSSGHLGFSAEL